MLPALPTAHASARTHSHTGAEPPCTAGRARAAPRPTATQHRSRAHPRARRRAAACAPRGGRKRTEVRASTTVSMGCGGTWRMRFRTRELVLSGGDKNLEDTKNKSRRSVFLLKKGRQSYVCSQGPRRGRRVAQNLAIAPSTRHQWAAKWRRVSKALCEVSKCFFPGATAVMRYIWISTRALRRLICGHAHATQRARRRCKTRRSTRGVHPRPPTGDGLRRGQSDH